MTFTVNKDGIVYQSDLGNKTKELAAAIEPTTPTVLGEGRLRLEYGFCGPFGKH